MNFIITKNQQPFVSLGEYNYCNLEDMTLPDKISIDSETGGLVARHYDIFCIQIGTGEHNYLIKMYDNEYTFYDLIPYIKGKTLVLHNALFDLGFFYKYNFFPDKIKDTMLASKILYNGDANNFRNDLSTCMNRELGIYLDKSQQKNVAQVKLSQPSVINYCFLDVHRLLDLHNVLENKIILGGYEKTYDLHCRYIRALAYIEQCGLAISSEKWKAKMEEDVKNTLLWKNKIEQYIYDNIPEFRDGQLSLFDTEKRISISVSSPLQMLKVFEKFNIPTKDKNSKDSINENIVSKSKHEFVSMWLNFQEANHRVSTFGNKVYEQIENERIYTNFNPCVDTSRLSTRRGHINFLNFPKDKETRGCFVTNKGNIMVVCDYGNQETVDAADLSGDEMMTQSVINGVDLHCAFARILFPELVNLSDDEIKENYKDKRQEAKAPRFAFAYGGNAFTIHMNAGIPLDEAQKIEKGFKELHYGLYEWGKRVYQESVRTGYINSVDGWKLKLPEFDKFQLLERRVKNISSDQWMLYRIGKNEWKEYQKDKKYKILEKNAVEFYKEKKKDVSGYYKLKSEYERLCLNNPVQTRAAHQLKLATCLFFEWILKNNYISSVLIDNSIHDELVIECEESLKRLVKKNLERCMLEGGNHYLTNLVIKADAHWGKDWFSSKK